MKQAEHLFERNETTLLQQRLLSSPTTAFHNSSKSPATIRKGCNRHRQPQPSSNHILKVYLLFSQLIV
ncbi:hypothetical protein HMPREF1981_01138 [Bacteroides pyogenes F0041]|uniref:Uncharacterized protein n=1 Tax=Bacteroides pyogenes F0041 TaxID=1321819 RepID=U2CN15_9BACE|nr:hypothetical protein HMPREF1981_01138 [Bacteroides pyogenes F0041]